MDLRKVDNMTEKVLLIDMYGVIIKESKGYFIPYTLEHFAEEEHARIIRAFREEQYFTKAGNGIISSDDFLKYLGYENPRETMKDYLENYLTLDEQFKPFAEKVQKECNLILLSNDVLEWSEYLTSFHGLNKYFKDKIISGQVHMRKPEKGIFSYALNKNGLKPEECIFIDNSVKNLLAAEELGINTVLFNRDNEEYSGIIVNKFDELEKIVM